MSRLRHALLRIASNHGTAVAYLALLLASSSAVYAAATVGSPQVIDNSLQSIDLRDGAAVKGIDIVNDSVGGADVNEASLSGVARKIVFSAARSSSQSKTVLLTVAGYTFKGRCLDYSDGETAMGLWVNGPAGDLQGDMRWWSKDNGDITTSEPGGALIPNATDTIVFDWFGGGGGVDHYYRGTGTAWIHSGTTLLEVSIHSLLDLRPNPPNCLIYATVTKAV